jgi:hypothetical protein
MRPTSVVEALRSLRPEAEVRFTLLDIPLEELLLTFHETRFTGAVDVGALPEVDRVFFREGAVVGLVPYRHLDAQLLGGILVEMKRLSRADLDAVLADRSVTDGVLLGQKLIARALIDEDTLNRACAEQARRRLYQLYDAPEAPVLVREGINRLARFFPTYVDVRPAIAYGLVMRSSAERKRDISHRVTNHFVRVVAPYDEKRNSYGLPPPVLSGMRTLSDGVTFDNVPTLAGLNAEMTAGLLLLLERMSLLRIEDQPRERSASNTRS